MDMKMRNIKNWILFIAIFVTSIEISGQTIDEIKFTGKYNWGVGIAENYPAARRHALQMLSESITVQITSQFTEIVKETEKEYSSYVEKVVTSYSATVLNQYEERILKEEPGKAEVLIFISKQNLQKVFDQRQQTINDFIVQGIKAENEVRLSDALRYYYWALMLTRSHPENTKLRHNFDGNTEQPVLLNLYDRINSIFTFIRVVPTTIVEQENPVQKQIQLAITYRNKPVQDLDYCHFTGDSYSGTISVRDGRGIVVLTGEAAKELKNVNFIIEYQYQNKAHFEPDVKFIAENVALPFFEKALIRVNLEGETEEANTEAVKLNIQTAPQFNCQQIRNNLQQIVNATKKRDYATVKQYFTTEGYDMYNKLIANGRVTVLATPTDSVRMMQVGNEIMARSIPMLFAFSNNNVKFVENVVFTFNQEGKVITLAYELGQKAIEDILKRPTGFGTPEEKYFLIKFMEDYKTAFALKRQDYLKAIFDDNALIIVGNMVKETSQKDGNMANIYGQLGDDKVQYIRMSKNEYMDRLNASFRRNEFINIKFEENEIRKVQGEEKIYGIQIAQHYYSSTYADKGYLFLMIDMTDSTAPKIYVRTWQPQKNEDGSVIGLEHFKLK